MVLLPLMLSGAASLLGTLSLAAPAPDSLPVIRREVTNGFSNGGWNLDRYADLPPLDAHTRMPVADIAGPGIIRHIHTTRHPPAELFARGIVLEIWFDDAEEPAVMCPLADFFGDGCNGASTNFSTPLIECAPWAYNCYIPMPFEKRARVYLRNDTDRDTWNYSYVEWEPLADWSPDLGYFHATYARRRFALTPQTSVVFFEARGAGHILGRQFSVLTEEPIFREFTYVMEGNNEIDIDGRERALDYLGSEDSFTFSWGFREPFAGLRAGMPHVVAGDRNELSIYRFHDHMPIRFQRELTWRINWAEERGLTGNPEWQAAVDRGGAMVDYATVFYWYQDNPGGYAHQPLAEVGLRGNKLPATEAELAAIVAGVPADERGGNTFDSAADLDRVRVVDVDEDRYPLWIDEPRPAGGHPGNPNPGRRGILGIHAAGETRPGHVLLKLRAPEAEGSRLRVVVSGDPYEAPGRSDFALRVGVVAGGAIQWLGETVVEAGSPPAEANWRTLEYELPAGLGAEVGVVVRVSYGGAVGAMNEEAFFDEISLVPAGS